MRTSAKNWLIPVLLAVPLLAHLGLGFRIRRPFHGDEIWTLMDVLAKSWERMPAMILKQDNHPPLYYFIAKGWTEIFGLNIPNLRWMSYLFTVLTICAMVWLYRSQHQKEKIFALGLLGTNPLLTYYSATVRPYSMLVMLAAVMTISAFQLKRHHPEVLLPERSPDLNDAIQASRQPSQARPCWSLLYYGSAFLLALTHYFGTLYVWVAILGDFITRRIETKPWKGIVLLGLTALWPLAQIFFGTLDQQSKANDWIRVVFVISTINNFLAGTFPLLMVSKSVPQYTFGVVLALFLLLLGLGPVVKAYWQRISRGSWSITSLFAPDAVFWSAVCFVVLVVGCLADALLPFTTPYYFLVCLPAVSILLAKLFSASMRDRYTGALCLLCILAIVALQIVLSKQRLALP